MDLAALLPKIRLLPPAEQANILEMLGILEVAQDKAKAQKHFLPFVYKMWPGFIHGEHHKIMAEAFDRVSQGLCKRLIINMPPRHRLALDTAIATTSGWKTIADVAVGDFVFAPSGAPTAVTGKSAVYDEIIYRVTTSDGQTVECDGEHLWTVRFGSGRPWATLSTQDILHRLDTESWRSLGNLPMLPRYTAAAYPTAQLEIDPYVLGVWLGDGSSWGGSIGCGYADMAAMRAQVEACGYATTHNPKFQQFNVLRLITQLKKLGLFRNKHIPAAYMMGSIDQRMALLQGLIDSDGDVTAEGKVTFNNSNAALIDDVLCLIHGLGVKARHTTRQTSYEGCPSLPSHRIMFTLSGAARLPRKAARCKDREGNWGRSIDIQKTERVAKVQCLEVANEDGLFMAGRGWVVTHNTKSMFASYLLPAWFLGKFPDKKIIQATHTAELSVNFGRNTRNLLASEDFQKVFDGVTLQSDSKAAGRWSTNAGGEYFAVGVGGAIAGKGADLFIIDDPHTEQQAIAAAHDHSIYDKAFEWYTSGPRQRLQPDAAIVIVMTRWGKRDLTGRLLQSSTDRDGTSEWEVIELPAILPSGKPLWPEYWSLESLHALKAELPAAKWNAQYQQLPTSEDGAILKREWWRRWEHKKPPEVELVMVSVDTAYTRNTKSDYSAFTVWGVFQQADDHGVTVPNLILLDSFQDRLEFPALKARAMEVYTEWEPDVFLVEAKASGLPLIHEMRHMGILVSEFTPSRASGDKIMRANSVTDLFASGVIWAPETKWADELIETCAAFPNGDHDDLVDSTVMALMRYRQGGFIRLASDYDADYDKAPERRRHVEPYY